MMWVQIGGGGSSVSDSGDDVAELTDRFVDWLAQDRSVGLHVTMDRVRPSRVEGAMSGDLADWISLTLSSGFSAASLIYSHLSFRASLPARERRAARMTIEHNGVRLVIEDGTEEDTARLVRLLSRSVDGEADTDREVRAGTRDGDGDGS